MVNGSKPLRMCFAQVHVWVGLCVWMQLVYFGCVCIRTCVHACCLMAPGI